MQRSATHGAYAAFGAQLKTSSRIQSIPIRTFSVTAGRSDEPDYAQAREWYRNLSSNPLPTDIGHVSYSRSSGPGGQNVNKVNSKAQLRVPLEQLLPRLPPALHPRIMSSHYIAGKSPSLLIQSDESRKRAANKDACYRKLHEIIIDIYKNVVPGETSEAQIKHVKQLKSAENESRLRLKKHLSSKKASRRGDDN